MTARKVAQEALANRKTEICRSKGEKSPWKGKFARGKGEGGGRMGEHGRGSGVSLLGRVLMLALREKRGSTAVRKKIQRE